VKLTSEAGCKRWWLAVGLLAGSWLHAAPVAASADLGITVSTGNDSPVAGGAAFSYTLTVTNNGPDDALGIIVTDPLPADVHFLGVAVVNNPSVPGYGLVCIGLPLGTNGTVTCEGNLPGSAPSTAVITITARVEAETAVGVRTNSVTVASNTQEADPNTAPNSASVQQNIQVSAPMSMVLAATAEVLAGENILYELTVNNAGPSAAINATITQDLPPGVQFLGLYGTSALHEACSANGGGTIVTCTPDYLPQGIHKLVVVTETFRLTTPEGPAESTVTLVPGTGTATNSPVAAVTQVVITRHTFTVAKDYSDDSEVPVNVTVTCDGDAVVVQAGAVPLSEGTPLEWEITRFIEGEEQNCVAQESPVPAGYEALGTPPGSCESGQVEVDGASSCTITNQQLPVDIYASKVFTSGGGSVTFAIDDCGGDATIEVVNDVASPGSPAHFIISDFPWDGATCNVTEPVPPGGFYVSATTCEGLLIVPSDEDTLCEITNSPTRATFRVTKQFEDGNDVDEVTVSIDCNTGLILDQDKLLADGEWVEFVVTSFTEGTLDCTITEDGESGYAGVYHDVGSGLDSDDGCTYEDIGGGEALECEISNSPLPVDVEITKEWVFESSSASDISTEYTLTLYCDSEIEGGNYLGDDKALDAPVADAIGCGANGLGGQYDWCKAHLLDGPAVVIDQVIPEFPDTQCEVVESGLDDAVEVDNGCMDITVSAGTGAACTITNTVFFEGIPTLGNQGKLMLALLVLVAGFVAYRRFN
jgi:uncharacterized repeat protein (TIGR01451 family)